MPSDTGCSDGEGGIDSTGDSDFGGTEDEYTFVEQPKVSVGSIGKALLGYSVFNSSD
jgi:hypothetical protein